MRSIGEYMAELGFKKDASDDVKKAFIKNLIRQAYGVEVEETPAPTPVKKKTKAQKSDDNKQLSFNFDDSQEGKKSKVG